MESFFARSERYDECANDVFRRQEATAVPMKEPYSSQSPVVALNMELRLRVEGLLEPPFGHTLSRETTAISENEHCAEISLSF